VRYDNCLACAVTSQRQLVALAMVAESLSPDSHHHHTVRCTDCGIWWFDDTVIGGLGLPVAARRDTVLCGCPEDGASRYEQSVVLIPMPEADCRCTAAEVERQSVPVRMRAHP
jgi:hypothetical protein